MDIRCIGSGSKGNAYLVSDNQTTILLECGVRFKQIQEACDFSISDIKACLITHEHKDHCRCVKDILKRGIEVYCTMGTAQVLEIITNPYCNVLPKYGQVFKVGSFEITAFEAEHDAVEPCGYLIFSTVTGEKLLFLTDSYYCRYSFRELTHILIECNYNDEILDSSKDSVSLKKRVLRSHMSLKNCIGFLTSKTNDITKVDCIHLIHLSDRNSDEEYMKRRVAEATGKRVVVF